MKKRYKLTVFLHSFLFNEDHAIDKWKVVVKYYRWFWLANLIAGFYNLQPLIYASVEMED